MRELGSYLTELGRHLRVDAARRRDILAELRTHVEERVLELQAEGVPPQQAVDLALQELGNSSKIGRGLYAVHTTGSWRDVCLASLPHLMLAILFALHLWTRTAWVVLGLAVATGVALHAWRRGRPGWVYPWLGYSLAAPAVAWVISLASLAYGAWSLVTRGALHIPLPLFIAIGIYTPLSLWAILHIARRVVRQDWLWLSLTALPLPFLALWFFLLQWEQGVLISKPQQTQKVDEETALVFLALAVTTGLFFKIGHRVVRIALLLVAAPAIAALAGLAFVRNPSSLPILIATATTAAFLLSPILLDSKKAPQELLQPSFGKKTL